MTPHAPWPPARQRLLWRIQRRYATFVQPVKLPHLTFDFIRIADPNRVLDDVAEREDRREKLSGQRLDGDELHLPYWAELWDSAAGVCQHLLQTLRSTLPGQRVLDLGCGMGLTGTVAAACQAKVTFADLEKDALLFARLNAWQFDPQVKTRQLNWRTDHLPHRFAVILGADILYERKQWEFLDRFWQRHLADDGQIILGEPGRLSGDQFIQWIDTTAWRLQQSLQSVETRTAPIRVFTLRRR